MKNSCLRDLVRNKRDQWASRRRRSWETHLEEADEQLIEHDANKELEEYLEEANQDLIKKFMRNWWSIWKNLMRVEMTKPYEELLEPLEVYEELMWEGN